MWRGIAHIGAWAAATGAAVLLSWLGVHAVLAAEAFDPPRTPTPGGSSGRTGDQQAASAQLPGGELGTATARAPEPSVPVASSAPPQADGGVGVGGQSGPPDAAPPPDPSRDAAGRHAAGSDVRSIWVTGGRVTLEMRPDSAELVSAAPEPGWEMRIRHSARWLRTDFSRGTAANSVLVTWDGHPPTVRTANR